MMPNLLNPVSVQIQRLDKGATQTNTRLRENVNIVKKLPILTINAQIAYRKSTTSGGTKDSPNWEGPMNVGLGGVIEQSEGYILVLIADIQSLDPQISRGDKIVKLGQFPVEHYILGSRPAAHYSDQGGFTLMQIFFADRNPT
jgi:hypothetical protein